MIVFQEWRCCSSSVGCHWVSSLSSPTSSSVPEQHRTFLPKPSTSLWPPATSSPCRQPSRTQWSTAGSTPTSAASWPSWCLRPVSAVLSRSSLRSPVRHSSSHRTEVSGHPTTLPPPPTPRSEPSRSLFWNPSHSSGQQTFRLVLLLNASEVPLGNVHHFLSPAGNQHKMC